MKVTFSVAEIPPKKDGASSMWNKAQEVPRLIALRQAALTARQQAGLTQALETFVKLDVEIFIPRHRVEVVGDLDNFLTGICDGLQAADPKAFWHPQFDRPELQDVHPRHAILLKNDSLVIAINAKKVPVPVEAQVTYIVSVEELVSPNDWEMTM
ncbi:hypothetical protein [Alicyclobacillus macrosporangiidus]|uniref:hypothetical protein n=1 Tax=Alicyclobacillus macrosporangiidus TaxID=392015 RepID=UPI000497F872|nr:hypothetical protein [Alicyclobacillus macrosporangiidus]